MNSLDQYNAVKSHLPVGTTVVYWGSGILSHAIEWLSDNGPSHAQVIDRIDPDGTIWVAESTIEAGRNGIQRNRLDLSIANYPAGSTCGALIISPEYNARADWAAASRFVDSVEGKVGYDVLGLVKFLEPEGLREGQINDHKEVCSAFVAQYDLAANLLVGIPYSQVSPEWLVEMGIYSRFIPLLGNPKPHNFNVLT